VVSVVVLATGRGMLRFYVWLLFLVVRRCGFYGIHIDLVIARVLVVLLRPLGWAGLGSLSFGFGSENCVCSAIFLHNFMQLSVVFGVFLASLEEHGPGLKPLTAAKIITSSVMPRVLALS